MPRIPLIQAKDDVAAEHHGLFDDIAALRGRVSGPSSVVLHSPTLARPWNDVSEYLHRDSVVAAADNELAICVAARHYDCSYIWNAHAGNARKAGVSDDTLNAVRDRKPLPETTSDNEALIVRYAGDLLQRNRVRGDVFLPLLSAHDERWIVELSMWVGRYAALACILNAFEVTPAEGAELLPDVPAFNETRAVRRPLLTPRIRQLTSKDMVPAADHALFDAIAEGRGNVRGPFSLLMHSPPLCRTILDVSNVLRFESLLTPYLRELVTITAAREKDCNYVWAAHAPAARKEGVLEATILAIRDRADVSRIEPAADRDAVDYTRTLLRTHRVPQALFDRMLQSHGTPRLVELTVLIGHYNCVASLLNACEVAPAAGTDDLPLY